MSKSVAEELQEVLQNYEEDAQEIIRDEIERVANDTAQELRQTSRGKSYPKGWSVKKEGGFHTYSFFVYNRTKPQLTHLLEKGHVVRNQFGTYGRVNGDGKIAAAEAKAEKELLDALKNKL